MKFVILLDKSALLDLQDAVRYYNRQSQGLGRRFGNVAKASIKELERFPFHPIRYQSVRCKKITDFPYMIHYTLNVEAGEVSIFAVQHTSKDPKTSWRDDR